MPSGRPSWSSAEIERIFDGIHSLLLAIDEIPSIRAFDTPSCSPYLKAIQEKVPYILSFVAMDISGHIRCRPTGTVDTQHCFADRPYFQDALDVKGLVVGEYTPVFEEGASRRIPSCPSPCPSGTTGATWSASWPPPSTCAGSVRS